MSKNKYLNFYRKLKIVIIDIFWNELAFIRYKYKLITRKPAAFASVELIKAHYINLDTRADRKVGLEKNLQQFKLIVPIRFSAINNQPGGVGCALSHLHLLLKNINDDYLCVVEDDFRLKISEKELESLIQEFFSNPGLDVLCIGNNQMRRCVPVSMKLGLTTSTQTTSMYIAKNNAIKVLICTCLKSIELYSRSESYHVYAIDQVWKEIQERNLNFCVPLKQAGAQEEGFSDIEMKNVKYDC